MDNLSHIKITSKEKEGRIKKYLEQFGLCENRSYYKTVSFGVREKRAIIVSALFLTAYTAAMIAGGLFVFGLGFS